MFNKLQFFLCFWFRFRAFRTRSGIYRYVRCSLDYESFLLTTYMCRDSYLAFSSSMCCTSSAEIHSFVAVVTVIYRLLSIQVCLLSVCMYLCNVLHPYNRNASKSRVPMFRLDGLQGPLGVEYIMSQISHWPFGPF